MGALQPPRQPQAPTLMCGATHLPLVLAAQGHPVGPAMETRAEIKQHSRHQEQPRGRFGVLQIATTGPGGPRGPGRPMLPWGPGKPCNGNSHIRGQMAQPGPWLPLGEGVLGWDWLIPGRLDGFGQPGGYCQGGYEYSHGCWSQVPLDHPVKNTLHQPNHPNQPATWVTGISSYLHPGGGPAQMSLPPAQ